MKLTVVASLLSLPLIASAGLLDDAKAKIRQEQEDAAIASLGNGYAQAIAKYKANPERAGTKCYIDASVHWSAWTGMPKKEFAICGEVVRQEIIGIRKNDEQAIAAAKAERAERRKGMSEIEVRENDLKDAAEKNKVMDEFVSKSKQVLVQNLKDPDSAKFTNLVVAENYGQKLLCGSINAKNSYGGYVGAKKFYVLWSDNAPEMPEPYTEGDAGAKAEARIDELTRAAQSAGLSAKIAAAQESDKVMANARKELARSTQILTEQCTAPFSTVTVVVDR